MQEIIFCRWFQCLNFDKETKKSHNWHSSINIIYSSNNLFCDWIESSFIERTSVSSRKRFTIYSTTIETISMNEIHFLELTSSRKLVESYHPWYGEKYQNNIASGWRWKSSSIRHFLLCFFLSRFLSVVYVPVICPSLILPAISVCIVFIVKVDWTL